MMVRIVRKQKITLKSVVTGKLKFSTESIVVRTKTNVTEWEKLILLSNWTREIGANWSCTEQ